MRSRVLLLLSFCALFLAGPAADNPAKPPTLKSESRLPAADLKGYYDADTWKVISTMPIAAYVIMRGPADRVSGEVTVTKYVASFPSETRNEFAAGLAKRVKLPYYSLGSRLPATADIFVIFYEPSPVDRQALIYGRLSAGEIRFYDIVQYRAKVP